MPDVLWYATLGASLGSTVACWYTVVWYVRRLRAAEQTCFARWKAIEEEQAQAWQQRLREVQAIEDEQTRAWLQRLRDVQAACPLCGLATAEPPDDTFSA